MVVEARQSFQFFKQITWFLRNNSAMSNLQGGSEGASSTAF